jgi:phosphatidylinositol dimannoside acyltransferase
MNLQSIINSRLGIALALGFGKTIPSGPGYRLTEWIGKGISGLRFLSLVKAARANQWVVSGETLTAPQLSAMTRATFSNTGYFLYDLYHHLDRPEALRSKVKFSPEFLELIARNQETRQGILFVVPHLSNVDLVGHAIGLSGFNFQVLSYPQPPGGYLWQNELRRRVGLNITPMSISALRQAGEHLRQGGWSSPAWIARFQIQSTAQFSSDVQPPYRYLTSGWL